MRLNHLAAGIAIALFPAVVSAQLVTVHSDGVSGDFDNLYDARDALLVDPTTPGIIEILDVGPFVGPAVAFSDTPVDGVQPYNLADITIRGAEGVKPILASTAASSVLTFNYVFGNVTIQNLILTGAVPNESTGITTGPQRAITFAVPGSPGVAGHTTSGRPMNIIIDDVVITSSYVTFTGGENPVIDQIVPATVDGITIAGINAPTPAGDLATFRLEGLNIFSTSQSLVNRIEYRNSVMSALPRASYGFRTFYDGAPGSEVIVGPNAVFTYITGAPQGTSQVAGAIQVGGNEGAPHIVKVRGTPEQPIIVHGNTRGVDITGSTPVSSIKSFENVIISDSQYEAFRTVHTTENYILQNVTIANSGQLGLGPAEPFIFGQWGSNENWQGSVVAENAIIAGNGTNDFRNLINVGSTAEPPGSASFTDSGIVLNGPFKLNTADWNQDGFDGLNPYQVTRTNVIDGDPQFISTTLGHPDFYRAGSAAYGTAGIDGAYGEADPIPPDSVTVHSDGVSGDFSSIQAAITAVQGSLTGVGTVTILDEGPFVQSAISIPGGSLQSFTLRGAPGVRPIIAGSAASNIIDVNNFYGQVVLENLLLTSATENGPVRAVRFTTTGPNHNTAGTPIDYLMDDVIITPSWRTPTDPPEFIPITLDGINFVPNPGDGSVFCNIRDVAVLGDSTSATIVSRKEFKNMVISGFPGMSYGIRSFFDGGEGTELIVGPNVVISYLTGTLGSASALQIGGNDGSAHILKVRGTIDEPVFLHGNTRGVATSGSTPVSSIKSFRHMLISDSVAEGFLAGHATENYILDSCTIVNSGLEAFTFGTFPATTWNGSITGSNLLLAGNGSSDARNVVRTFTEAGGIATLSDGAVVLEGPFEFTGNGFTAPEPTNVSQTNILNGDPNFISTTFGDAGFYRPGAAAYVNNNVLGPYALPPLPPAYVTVHSDGVTGDFATIQAAVNAVVNSDSSKVIVEILDEGPFIQDEVLVQVISPSITDFTIRGVDGVMPIVVGTTSTQSTMRFSHFYGKILVENMILTSGVSTVASAPLRGLHLQTGAGNQNTAGRAIDYVINNVIVTSSVRTQVDPPVYVPVTTDGITVAGFNAPAISGDLCTIRNEAIRIDSTSNDYVNRLALQNSVISAMTNTADGLRTFFDGAEGSEVMVGPNVLMSYLVGSGGQGAIQVGGNEGSDHILKVRGTPENPIILHGNRRGVALTGTTRVGSIKSFENVIISESLLEGFLTGDLNENYIFTNVTIADSGQDAGANGSAAFTPSAAGWTGTLMATNTIFAGDGSSAVHNVLNFFSDSGTPGTAVLQDGAIVLNGPFRLTGDGIVDTDPTNVTDTNNLYTDPQFISTVLGNPDFYRPGAADYIQNDVLGGYGESGVTPVELGDINGDGVVNVADVTALANIVAAGQQNTLNPAVADINDDGFIDEDDVTALAGMIVNQ